MMSIRHASLATALTMLLACFGATCPPAWATPTGRHGKGAATSPVRPRAKNTGASRKPPSGKGAQAPQAVLRCINRDLLGEPNNPILRIVNRSDKRIHGCYREVGGGGFDRTTKVKVAFDVGTEGTITDAVTSGASPELSACIVAIFLAIRGLPVLPAPQTFTRFYVFSNAIPSPDRHAKQVPYCDELPPEVAAPVRKGPRKAPTD